LKDEVNTVRSHVDQPALIAKMKHVAVRRLQAATGTKPAVTLGSPTLTGAPERPGAQWDGADGRSIVIYRAGIDRPVFWD